MVKKSSFTRMARWRIMEVSTEDFAMKLGSFCLIALASVIVLAQMAGCQKPAGSAPATSAVSTGASPQVSASSASAASKEDQGKLTTAHAVLDKMVDAYHKAPSYEDLATVELWEAGKKEPNRADFRVVFQRPNKLRMTCYQGELACDGKQWFGYSKDIPFQAVLRDAPPTVNMQMLTADKELDRAINGGFAGGTLQALFLLSEQPLDMLLYDVRDQDLTLGDPVRLGDYDCYRVCYRQNEGAVELWIDEKTFVLRHMQFTANAAPGHEGEAPGESDRIEAHFERARLGGEINPDVFKIAVPDGTECHRALLNPASYRIIGTKLADFQIVDAHGNPWKSQSLAGKVAVVHLWRTDVLACPEVLPGVEQAYEKFKDNPRIAFVAINIDGSQVETKTIEETARKWKLTMPILRDPNMDSAASLKNTEAPVTLFVDEHGVVQDRIRDDKPISTAATARKIEDLLAGKDLSKQALQEANERFKVCETEVDKVFSGEAVTATFKQADATPAAGHSEPRKLRLTRLWKSNLNGIAANILVAPVNGKPRVLVVDGFKAITEIGLDGAVGESHSANLTEKELITNLRTAAGKAPGQPGDGKRCFAAFGPWQQRIRFFDESLKPTVIYPEDALENPHPGITDVELADLLGDGQVNAYVGFGGVVGVQNVTLEGKRLASCRAIINIGRVTAGPPDAMHHRQLYCVTDGANVAILDPKLQVSDSIKLGGDGVLEGLLQADLAGDGHVTWCELLRRPDARQPVAGQYTAIGLNVRGEAIWKYDMPAGSIRTVEPIVVGRILPGTASQWILPGCDGSVHILSADGTLIDRFNYGAQINGLATVEIDGKPVLLISSANGVEALRVE